MTVPAIAPKLSKREIKRISLRDFEARKQDITDQLMEAASDLGFFTIENTGISQSQVRLYTHDCPSKFPRPIQNICRLQIDSMFARGAAFFALDDKVKSTMPCDPATFVGWEKDAEISPATGAMLV